MVQIKIPNQLFVLIFSLNIIFPNNDELIIIPILANGYTIELSISLRALIKNIKEKKFGIANNIPHIRDLNSSFDDFNIDSKTKRIHPVNPAVMNRIIKNI